MDVCILQTPNYLRQIKFKERKCIQYTFWSIQFKQIECTGKPGLVIVSGYIRAIFEYDIRILDIWPF